jgi:hypothetical protein
VKRDGAENVVTLSPPDAVQAERPEDEAASLAALRAAFQLIVSAGVAGQETRHLRIAGQLATLCSADRDRLAAFGRPFRHLIADPAEGGRPEGRPTLTIHLLGRTGAERPPHFAEADESAPGSPDRFAQAVVRHGEGGRFVGYRRGGTVAALDRSAGSMVVWCGDDFPAIDRGQPLFPLFAVWLHDLDLQLVHAGLVARGENGALLGGAGGSGKSTTALACMRSGMAYLGDDLIALELPETGEDGASARGFSLYNSARLEPRNLERFPELQGTVEPLDPNEPDKLVLYPLDGEGEAASSGTARIRAVLLPRVTAGPPRAVPLSPAKALLGLAPSSIRAMAPQPMAAGLERLAKLVERVPCYQLQVSEDLAAVAEEVERVIHESAEDEL